MAGKISGAHANRASGFAKKMSVFAHPNKRAYPNLFHPKNRFQGKNISIYSIMTLNPKA